MVQCKKVYEHLMFQSFCIFVAIERIAVVEWRGFSGRMFAYKLVTLLQNKEISQFVIQNFMTGDLDNLSSTWSHHTSRKWQLSLKLEEKKKWTDDCDTQHEHYQVYYQETTVWRTLWNNHTRVWNVASRVIDIIIITFREYTKAMSSHMQSILARLINIGAG